LRRFWNRMCVYHVYMDVEHPFGGYKAFPEFKFANRLGIVLEKLKQSQVQSVILTYYFSGIA